MTKTSWNVVLKQVHSLAGTREHARAEDADLLGRFLSAGDEQAFEALLRRHGAMVFRVARRVLRSEADAEDVFQATFLLLARKAGSIRRRSSLASWLHGVAHRLALHARADRARRRERESRAAATPAGAWQELDGVLDEALAGLPEKYRTPLVYCYLEGRTQEEVAQQLGAPLGTVRSWIARGRELLRKRLIRRGITLSAAGVSAALVANAAEAASLSMSGPVVQTTLQAVPGFVAAKVLHPSISARVAALVREGLGMLVLARLRGVAVGLLALALLFAGVGLGARQVLDAPAAPSAAAPQGRAAAEEQPRVDRLGDPLPTDAVARLGTERFRHESWIGDVVLSPDDRTLFAVANYSLVSWDAATGHPRTLFRASNQLRCLALAPDGKTLAVGEASGSIHIIDPQTGKMLHSWNTDEGAPPARLGAGANLGGIRQLRFTPDGRGLLSGASTQTDNRYLDSIRLWDLDTGKELHQFTENDCGYSKLSPDGKLLAIEALGRTSQSHLVRLVEFATGKEVRRLSHTGQVGMVAFSPDGRSLAVAVGDQDVPGKIVLWDLGTGKEIATLAGHEGRVYEIAFAPDGKSLLSGGQDQTIRQWDLTSHKERQKSPRLETPIYGLHFFGDGKGFVSSGSENRVRIWDVEPLRERLSADGPSQYVSWLTFTPDGKRLVTASGSYLWNWDRATSKLVRALENRSGYIAPAALSADGKVLVSQGDRDVLHVWDPVSGQERRRIETRAQSNDPVSLSPDGAIVAACSDNRTGSIVLWDTTTGKKLRTLEIAPESPGVRSVVYCLCFTGDGKSLYACSGTHRNVLRWDVSTGNSLPPLGPHDGGVNRIALASDDRSLAVATLGGSVYLWELATGQLRLQVKNAGYATGLAFSPDGRLLALANSGAHEKVVKDGKKPQGIENRDEVRLLRVADGKVMHRFVGHTGGVYCLSFSPDGRTLASGGADTTTLLWAVPGREAYESKAAALTPKELTAAWQGLGGDAAEAHPRMGRLIAAPTQTVPLLREQLQPVVAMPAERVVPLLKKLDSDQFAEREEAMASLRKLGAGVLPALRKCLQQEPSAELRHRLEILLDELGDGFASAGHLRGVRALEVLERIDSLEARDLVKRLAGGAEGAWLTDEARRTLRRMR